MDRLQVRGLEIIFGFTLAYPEFGPCKTTAEPLFVLTIMRVSRPCQHFFQINSAVSLNEIRKSGKHAGRPKMGLSGSFALPGPTDGLYSERSSSAVVAVWYLFSARVGMARRDVPRPRQSERNKPRVTCEPRPTLRRNLAARTARRAIPTLAVNTYVHRGRNFSNLLCARDISNFSL